MAVPRTAGARWPPDSISTWPSPSIRPSSSWPSPTWSVAPADRRARRRHRGGPRRSRRARARRDAPALRLHGSVYLTGDGFAQSGGVPSSSTLVIGDAGLLYLARTGTRFTSGEDVETVHQSRLACGI